MKFVSIFFLSSQSPKETHAARCMEFNYSVRSHKRFTFPNNGFCAVAIPDVVWMSKYWLFMNTYLAITLPSAKWKCSQPTTVTVSSFFLKLKHWLPYLQLLPLRTENILNFFVTFNPKVRIVSNRDGDKESVTDWIKHVWEQCNHPWTKKLLHQLTTLTCKRGFVQRKYGGCPYSFAIYSMHDMIIISNLLWRW